MSVRIKRQLNNLEGGALTGASYSVFEVGQSAAVATGTVDSEGIIDLSLDDERGGRTNVKYDIKVEFSGQVWWIRAADEAQVAAIDVTDFLRLPRYTTTERDALSLGTTDAGTQLYNTDDEETQVWSGSEWLGAPTEQEAVGGFDVHDDVTTENDNPDGGDRLVTSKENASGDPNRWLSLTRLRTWLQTNLSLNASRITAGRLSFSRMPENVLIIRSGTADPDDSVGVDGDLYLKLES